MHSSLPNWLFVCFAVLSACGQHEEVEPEADASDGEALHEVHWGYGGEIGPEQWADLRPEFTLCGEGTEQSPIDLVGARAVEGTALVRKIGEEVLTLEQRAQVLDLMDNGHTIQVTSDAAVAIDLDDEHYDLVQYHFHAPSEHTIGGVHAPLEVHSVHKSAAGKLAVLGVLVEEGERNPGWDPLLVALPSGPGDARHLEVPDIAIDKIQLEPESYYRYRGSLTTPPCSESVEWIVAAEKHQISPEQMAALTSHLRDNNRPVQALGNREILLVSN